MKNFCVFTYRFVLTLACISIVFMGLGTMAVSQDELFTELFTPSTRLCMLLFLTVLVCMAVLLLFRRINQWGRRSLIFASFLLFGLMTTVFVVFLINFRIMPLSDALNVQDAAMYLAQTDLTQYTQDAPHAEYFTRTSNNYFTVRMLSYFFRMLDYLGVKNYTLALMLLGAAAMMTANVFLYLTGIRLAGLRVAVKVLVLCVLNPLYYIPFMWVYSNTLSIPFMAAVPYFGICIYLAKNTRQRVIYSILEGCCIAVGFYIRATVLIPAIALLICGVLYLSVRKERWRQLLPAAVTLLVVVGILYRGIGNWSGDFFQPLSGNRNPLTHWLMIGSHGTGEFNWKDARYTLSFKSTEEKKEATKQRIIENYQAFTPAGYLSFLQAKSTITWCYADGKDIYNKIAQDTKNTKLYSWVIGDRSDLFRMYCYAFRLTLIFLISLSLLRMLVLDKRKPILFLFVLTLLGGVLFHFLWEVKPTYSLPFLGVMLLLGADGGNILAEKAAQPEKKEKHPAMQRVYFVISLCVLCLCMISYAEMTLTNINRKVWSVHCTQTRNSVQKIKDTKGKLHITQEFYASEPFNRIGVLAGADKKAAASGKTYLLRLSDSDGQILSEQTICAKNVTETQLLVFNTDRIVPDGRQKYMISLTLQGRGTGAFSFKERTNETMDCYEGLLTVNEHPRNNDLFLQVYDEYESAWCSPKAAICINGGLFGLYLLLLCLFLHPRNQKLFARKSLDKK